MRINRTIGEVCDAYEACDIDPPIGPRTTKGNAAKSPEQLAEIACDIIEAAENIARLNEDYSILADKLFGSIPECDQACNPCAERGGAVGQLYFAVDVLNERIATAREIVRRFNNLA